MVAGTVIVQSEVMPAWDVVTVTANDGETYTTKLSSIIGVSCGGAGTATCTYSGRTVTISRTGMLEGTPTLIIAGRL